jgi:hypothetical protein
MTEDFDRLPGSHPSTGATGRPRRPLTSTCAMSAKGWKLTPIGERQSCWAGRASRSTVPSLMAELSDDLFEALLAAGLRSSKAIAQVALALKRDDPYAHDDEHCPHCDGLLHRRRHEQKGRSGDHEDARRRDRRMTWKCSRAAARSAAGTAGQQGRARLIRAARLANFAGIQRPVPD